MTNDNHHQTWEFRTTTEDDELTAMALLLAVFNHDLLDLDRVQTQRVLRWLNARILKRDGFFDLGDHGPLDQGPIIESIRGEQ